MNIFTSPVLCALLLALIVCLAATAVLAGWRVLRRRKITAERGAIAGLVILGAACTILAQKRSTITFDALIVDTGSYATNDVLHVEAEKAPAAAFLDLTEATLLVYRREADQQEATDWVECLPRRTFGDLPADWYVPDATNYNYRIYVDYVPPSPVHTNGVWQMRGFEVPGHADTYAFPNTRQETIR